ncbi:MAG: universal stress protein [Myxococcales bacterium]|nr:universal stress protein [Myxococcales bacterium]
MKRILVPTDFSPLSEAAFAPAVVFAKKYGAEITVIHIIDALEYNASYPYLDLSSHHQQIQRLTQEHLAAAAEKLSAAGAEKVHTTYRVGTPFREVTSEVEHEEGTDLLVVATHGFSGFRRFVVGSVAESIVRRSKCPVLSVHSSGTSREFAIRRVLVPTDLSPRGDAAVLQADKIAAQFGATIELFFVDTPPVYGPGPSPMFGLPVTPAEVQSLRGSFENHLNTLAKTLTTNEVTIRVEEAPHPSEAIAARAKDGGFDAIFMGSHGRRGLHAWVIGSVAERVVRIAEIPVLVLKSQPNDNPETDGMN